MTRGGSRDGGGDSMPSERDRFRGLARAPGAHSRLAIPGGQFLGFVVHGPPG